MLSLNPLFCKHTGKGFVLAWQFCPEKDRMAAVCFCVVVLLCAVMWCGNQTAITSARWMGEKRAGLVFSADLCTSDQRWSRCVYIYVCAETWWSERRDIVLDTCWNTASQQVRPQPLFLSTISILDFAALLLRLCSFTCQVSAQGIMEAAICTLITQFKQYAGKDGSSSTLSKDEFHSLVTSQLPNYVQVHPQHMQTL